ncbi:MAG: Peptidoglycan-binding LysM:Lytic transglycosylase, catalytic, partial [Proteobacteria bacterium]|nr:Peptidoglycan-binding LysM:Lytic transglycosylase, catalytic [Pseudomonadota bacterium]
SSGWFFCSCSEKCYPHHRGIIEVFVDRFVPKPQFMQQRNLSSFLRRLCITCLTAAILLPVAPALAESADKPSLFSLMMPSLSDSGFSTTEDVLTVQEIRVPPQLPNTIDLTTQANNLWDRIRNGFAMTNLNDDLVLYYQQWYQNRPDALRRMVERSRPYLHYIVEELEARGMPTELALLPMVESSFNPNAYSPAHAAGLWQFIPATGKRFNLEQNWWRDERRDIVASTGAARRRSQKGHRQERITRPAGRLSKPDDAERNPALRSETAGAKEYSRQPDIDCPARPALYSQ